MAAKQFLKKDHHDTNMVVAVRLRPLSSKEIYEKQFDIISVQDKMIVSYSDYQLKIVIRLFLTKSK